jgi:hypothetical protein
MKARSPGTAIALPRTSAAAGPPGGAGLLALMALALAAPVAAVMPAPGARLEARTPRFEPQTFSPAQSVVARGSLFVPQPVALPGGTHSLKGSFFLPVPHVFGSTTHVSAAGPFPPAGPQPQTPILAPPH